MKKLTKKQLNAYVAEYEKLEDRLGYLKYEAWFDDGLDHSKEIDQLIPRLNKLEDILTEANYFISLEDKQHLFSF